MASQTQDTNLIIISLIPTLSACYYGALTHQNPTLLIPVMPSCYPIPWSFMGDHFHSMVGCQFCVWWGEHRKWISLCLFTPESFVLRDNFGCSVPCPPDEFPHPGWIWCFYKRLQSPFPLSATVSNGILVCYQAIQVLVRPRSYVTIAFTTENPLTQAQWSLRLLDWREQCIEENYPMDR